MVSHCRQKGRLVTLQPLDHQPRAESAAAALRRAILEGRLPPGTQLREVHIAAELGVSRAPLREALRSLEEEGLVVRHAYRGAFVAEIGAETVQEIASLRVRLEPFAIQLSLPRLRTPEGAGLLRAALDRLDERSHADDVPGSIDAHLAVHRLFYELAEHRLLLDSWRSWESQLRLYLSIDHSTFTAIEHQTSYHQGLVDAITRGTLRDIDREVKRHLEPAAHAVSHSRLVHSEQVRGPASGR
jgi:DNA-binding GntR family transcriptional regulator